MTTKVEYTKIYGGLDTTSPALAVQPGRASFCKNYEAGNTGGLRRIDGYERFDGRSAPSAATYYQCAVSLTGAVVVGDTITGVTSSKTAVVAATGTGYLVVTKVSGTFTASENLTVGGSPVGALVGSPVLTGAATSYAHAVALNAAADIYRADIKAPGAV